MRELSFAECQQVIGGFNESSYDPLRDVEVWGSRRGFGPMNFLDGGIYDLGESSGVASYTNPMDQYIEDNRPHIDCKARSAAKSIISNATHKNKEFGGWIYKAADGSLQVSNIIENIDGNEPGNNAALLMQEADGIGWANIVGFIHNHDDRHYGDSNPDSEGSYRNQAPSENDWIALNYFENNAGHEMLLYILDTNDMLRVYEDTDNHNTPKPDIGLECH